ncbi:transposase [Streptomyces apocyni]|uniref:transposase n=1 Tax=Streptomyces apocyni TaxID=2654677 RepID=UPI0012EA9988|nr:transposase [Streptomyces apocyni]
MALVEIQKAPSAYPVTQHSRPAIVAQFASTDCRACPSRTHCTSSRRGSRILTLRPKELHEIQTAARAEQKTRTWRDKYELRAGVESTINQALDMTGIRRACYRRLAKVRLQHLFSATALNVIRLDDDYWSTTPLSRPRTSRLEHLAYILTA